MKKHRTAGTLRIKALVQCVGDIFVLDEAAPRQLRIARNLLNHTLGAFGKFRLGKEIELQDGAVLVRVLDVSDQGAEHFDDDSYNAFLREVQDCMSTPLSPQDPELDLSDRTVSLAAKTGCDTTRIGKALSMIGIRHGEASLLVEQGDTIKLGASSHLSASEERFDIVVAGKNEYTRIETSSGTFTVAEADLIDLKPGDRVVLVDPGPCEKRRCIFADRAELVEEGEPELFD